MLYHFQKGIPQEVKAQLPKGTLYVRYSRHATESRYTDRYGLIPEIDAIDTAFASVIEVETEGANLVKVVYRMSLDLQNDICLVVLTNSNLVKTTWINRKSDIHKTVDFRKYN